MTLDSTDVKQVTYTETIVKVPLFISRVSLSDAVVTKLYFVLKGVVRKKSNPNS